MARITIKELQTQLDNKTKLYIDLNQEVMELRKQLKEQHNNNNSVSMEEYQALKMQFESLQADFKNKESLLKHTIDLKEEVIKELKTRIEGLQEESQTRIVNIAENELKELIESTINNKLNEFITVTKEADNTNNTRNAGRKKYDNVEVIELIKELRNKGESFKKITDNLNSQGYLTDRGKPWNSSSIKYILDNNP